MKLAQWPVLATIRRLNRRDVFFADHASGPDRLLWPTGYRMTMSLEPYIREHPGPASVPVRERMNGDRSMMETRRLIDQGIPPLPPEGEVIEECLKLDRGLMSKDAQIQILPTELSAHVQTSPNI